MAALPSAVEARDVPVVAYGDLAAQKDLSAEVEQAFGREGLGVLAVSGVPELDARRSELLPLAFAFAQLPDAAKARCELPEAFYSFGWSHGKEKLQGQPDVAKGSYYNNPEVNDLGGGDQQLVDRFPSFYHANIWPRGAAAAAAGRLLHYFALTEEQIAAQSEAATLEDSFAWCGWHNDHGALTGLVQAMFTDSTGAAVPNPDPQAGLYVKNRRGEILKANIPPGHLVYQIGETSQILSGGTLQATPHAVRGPQVTGVNRETLAVFMQPLPQERMAVPPGSLDPLEAGKTENLPKGVPPLLSRWHNGMSYDDFTQATHKAYY
ncbi:unnamed protein product [Phytophthora fragariaefolia]|uniref:Unnamed protein product n=1 Tax=Phytophthora fragariaefolia TaxID=1490495 RepID=A0A9W6XFV2_9STRA|nr:unnamed protein product [Phytophthora fragariaefolia]